MRLFTIGGAKIEKFFETEPVSHFFVAIFVLCHRFTLILHTQLMNNRLNENIILCDGRQIPFEQFFKEGFPKFYAFAGRFITEPFAREDIVQEAFIEVWGRRLNHFKDEPSLQGYIYTFIKNKCIDHIRHHKIKEQFSSRQAQEKSSDDFLLQSIIDEETRSLIHQAVRQLTPQCRQVIQLGLEGKKIKEIAQAMGLSEVTVKFHKASAYKQLYKSLSHLLLKIITFGKTC